MITNVSFFTNATVVRYIWSICRTCPAQKNLQLTICPHALLASTIRIKLKIEKNLVIYGLGGQICFMRSSRGPDLSFETLKSEFDCITKKKYFPILGIFGQNWEKLSIFLQSTENYNKQYLVTLHYFEDFFLKNFLSSRAFSKYWHLYYIRSPQCPLNELSALLVLFSWDIIWDTKT